MREVTLSDYRSIYKESLDRKEAFWAQAANNLDWDRQWDSVLNDDSLPNYHWFAGGRLNTCFNAVDRHVAAGHGAKTALIYDSPVTDTVDRYSYQELLELVSTFSGALAAANVAHGDRVIIYMPMVPDAVVAMLACARIGAIHSVVFGGFAAAELATRIDDASPKVIISASCGIEPTRVVEYKPLLDEAIDLARHKPDLCVVLQRPQCHAKLTKSRDIEWNDFIADVEPADCVPVDASDPLYNSLYVRDDGAAQGNSP